MKINKKRLSTFIIITILVIAIIVTVICVACSKKPKITLNGSEQEINGGGATNNQQEIEYDGNPYNVPQDYIQSTNKFVDQVGEEIKDTDLSEIKQKMIDKFKNTPKERLELDVDVQNVSIIFNNGTTTIADSTCLVFAVYTMENSTLTFLSKYAISLDLSVMYKYDSDTFYYNMIDND